MFEKIELRAYLKITMLRLYMALLYKAKEKKRSMVDHMAIIWPIDDILILREKSYRNGHKNQSFAILYMQLLMNPFFEL